MKGFKTFLTLVVIGVYSFAKSIAPIITADVAALQMQNSDANFVTWQVYKSLMSIAPYCAALIIVLIWMKEIKMVVSKITENKG